MSDTSNFGTLLFQEKIGTLVMEREYKLFSMLRPSIKRDGNKWCVLYGENLESGIAGFGDSPYEAILDFNAAWNKEIKSEEVEKEVTSEGVRSDKDSTPVEGFTFTQEELKSHDIQNTFICEPMGLPFMNTIGVQAIAKERYDQLVKHGHSVKTDSQIGYIKLLEMVNFCLSLDERYLSRKHDEVFVGKIKKKHFTERYAIAGALLSAAIDVHAFRASPYKEDSKEAKDWIRNNPYYSGVFKEISE